MFLAHKWSAFIFCLFVCLFVEKRAFYIALFVWELPVYARVTSDSLRSTCLYLTSARIKDMDHHTQFFLNLFH